MSKPTLRLKTDTGVRYAFGGMRGGAGGAQPAPLRAAALEDSCLPFVVDNIPHTQIRPSLLHGNGLFATQGLYAGAVLCHLDGQRVEWASHDAISQQPHYGEASADLFMEWNALSPEMLLIRPFRTKYSFINHSRHPNVGLLRHPLRVVALCDITESSEITIDYRDEPLCDDYMSSATFL